MKVTLKAKPGQKSISFEKGGLHKSTNTPANEKIPVSKMEAALTGKDGPLARKQALFARNVLTGRK